MDLYTGLWLGWGAAFVLIEGSAFLGHKKGRTLSETLWRWFDVRNQAGSWSWKRYALLAFLVWLLIHLVFKVLPS